LPIPFPAIFLSAGTCIIVDVRIQVRALRTTLLLALTATLITGVAQLADLSPRPELTPQQVVQYQITALQRNDDPQTDAGIERAFRFASPSNKTTTGPLEKFAQIVKSAAYAPLLNNIASSIVGLDVEDAKARVAVKVFAASGRRLTYVFVLSRQSAGEFADCWMTDAVLPIEEGEDSPGQGLTI
jgi:hypothetical protein